MRQNRRARKFVQYLVKFIGIQYHYGDDQFRGDDPIEGFDCSGLVTEGLRAIGELKWNQRFNAQMFYDRYVKDRNLVPNRTKPGCLLFFGTAIDHVSHIAIVLDRNTLLEAGGGSRDTKSKGIAAVRNAFVRLRPITYRRDLIQIADPFMYSSQ